MTRVGEALHRVGFAANRPATAVPVRRFRGKQAPVLELELGRSTCGDLASAERREWLVTNGLGGFAAGTVAGSLTRRYHGLLFAATRPPAGRTLFVTKIDEAVDYDGASFELATNRRRGGVIAPAGYALVERFALRGTRPEWTYAIADALLEKSIWMERGANATYVRYAYVRGKLPIDLGLRILVNYRDLHAVNRAGKGNARVTNVAGGIRVDAFSGAEAFFVLADRASLTATHDWYRDFELAAETERGLEDGEDHLCAARAQIRLEPGDTLAIVATDRLLDTLDAAASLARLHERETQLVARWERAQPEARRAPAWVRRCVLAADAFLVARPFARDPEGRSAIAGYPWFGDWSRDTMIALPGLTLATGRPEIAASILRTFATLVVDGMLPNYLPGSGEAPQYNSVDAPLWFVEAVAAYVDATGDRRFLQELFGVLEQTVAAYRDGTRYGIGLDPRVGLLRAGVAGVQLTWMDAKVGDRVITRRIGKPVEISALWYDAMRRMAALAPLAARDPAPFAELAENARSGFERFWNEKTKCCYDVLDGPDGPDPTLRPNQLFAVSLPFSPLPVERQRAVVEICGRRLLAGSGMRSLDPADARYEGHYGGSPATRDAAYHQGTSWLWLLGVFATADARAFGDAAGARRYLDAFGDAIVRGALGTLGELEDGDAPFAPRGEIAQAWSVGEALRAWHDAPRFARADGGASTDDA